MSVWVGTYGAKGGAGLYPLEVGDGRFALGAPELRIANASYAAWSPDGRTAYFVDERESGRVSAWRWTETHWEPAGEASSGGALPCYVTVHPTGEWLAVANYGDGSVGLLRADPASGRLLDLVDTRQHSGRGPDPKRQDGPHAHCALFGPADEGLYVVDLGLDRIFRYPFGDRGLGDAEVAFTAPPGSGPRHLAWHPDGRHALLLCELSAQLLLLQLGQNLLQLRDAAPTSLEGNPDNLGGHLAVAPDGAVFVTNRGDDSLVKFAIEGSRLMRGATRPTGGSSPRHFVRFADGFLVAHEKSGTLSLLGEDGSIRSLAVPGAAFVLDQG